MNKCRIFFFCLLLVFAACAPKEPAKRIFEPEEPGRALFQSAEEKYRSRQYARAETLFRQYLEQYPDTSLAPAAMMKLGRIRMHQSDFARARRTFERLVQDHPGTRHAAEARLGILESYFEDGRFNDAVAYRSRIPEEELAPRLRVRADRIAGDAYMALEKFRNAYERFLAAYRASDPDGRENIAGRLLAALAGMDADAIRSEIGRLDGEPPTGYLMYQQGLNFMSEGRIGDALTVFQRLLNRFPDHPKAPDARQQMDRLTAEAFFEGNTLGCLLPLSGKYKKFGRKAQKGIELAVFEAQEKTAANPPFRLLIRDSASDPETARRAVRELAENGVAAIIGPMVVAGQVAPLAQKLGIPLVALTQKPDIAAIGDYVFRNFLTPRMQVSALAEYTVGSLGCRRFAVLYPKEPYGETFLHLFWDALLERNARVTGVESYSPGDTDFSEPIQKLVGLYHELPVDLKPRALDCLEFEALFETMVLWGAVLPETWLPGMEEETVCNAGQTSVSLDAFSAGSEKEAEPRPIVDFDAVFIPDEPEKAGLIVPQLRYHDVNDVYLLGTNLWHSPQLVEIARDEIGKAIIPEGFFAESRRDAVSGFVRSFSDVYRQAPGFIEAVSYDSAMIVCTQMARPEVASRPALLRALLRMPAYEGVTGRTSFSKTGEAEKTVYLLRVVNGRFAEILP